MRQPASARTIQSCSLGLRDEHAGELEAAFRDEHAWVTPDPLSGRNLADSARHQPVLPREVLLPNYCALRSVETLLYFAAQTV